MKIVRLILVFHLKRNDGLETANCKDFPQIEDPFIRNDPFSLWPIIEKMFRFKIFLKLMFVQTMFLFENLINVSLICFYVFLIFFLMFQTCKTYFKRFCFSRFSILNIKNVLIPLVCSKIVGRNMLIQHLQIPVVLKIAIARRLHGEEFRLFRSQY